jgi:hypothetical protein
MHLGNTSGLNVAHWGVSAVPRIPQANGSGLLKNVRRQLSGRSMTQSTVS